MATSRSHPSLVMDVQVLVTHAASVATMEREMGHPPRIIRGPDLCDLCQARDEERLPDVVDRLGIVWHRGAGGPAPSNGGAVDP